MTMDDNSTLILVWVFSWVAFAIMMVRLILRKVRKQPFILGDYLTMGAIFCTLARLGLIHVVLIWGSNNVKSSFRKTHHFTAQEIYQREVGSKLTLVNRVFYNSYLWLQKLVLFDFTRRLIRNLPWEKKVMISFMTIFAGSYVACQVVTFTECDPFDHYWQVLPDPGSCSQAQVQLIVLGVLNVITDFMLMALPIPILIRLRRPFSEKLQIIALFCMGFLIIAVTIIRLPQNRNHATAQVNRTTWASVELLAAAIVANAPTIYSLRKAKENASRPTYSKSDKSSRLGQWSWRGWKERNTHTQPTLTQDEEDEIPLEQRPNTNHAPCSRSDVNSEETRSNPFG